MALLAAPDQALASDPEQPPVSGWVQYTAQGPEFRVVAAPGSDAACPSVSLDGQQTAMAPRAAASADFPLVCAIAIPAGTKSLRRGALDVALPSPDPLRILVLGDTGCRIKGTALQACNDPVAWPFAGLARAAAALKPDLIVHLGDYLYRESPCPADFAGCAGSPHGDNWASWDADFFAPAAPLLAAAPWVIIRGNHEDCARAGLGFLRLLGPVAFDSAAPCIDHLEPYAVQAGGQAIAVTDTAFGSDQTVDDTVVALFRKDFDQLGAMAGPGGQLWLASHRPIWAAITGPLGIPIGGSVNLIEAAGDLKPLAPVSLMLSGHIHSFEAINYTTRNRVTLAPQIVAGHGGDNLDVTPANLKHAIFQGHSGVNVKDGLSVGGFGFLTMTREGAGWSIQLYDSAGVAGMTCAFASGRLACVPPK
ncbi:MAG TPA: metallophosphoesterase [Rhizomicrobium sp.]